MIEFVSITRDPSYAARLWALPGNTVMVDLERAGKHTRQASRDTVISGHTPADVIDLAGLPDRGPLLVRIDPVLAGGLTQLPLLCDLGVDRVMLPMFEERKSVDEAVRALEQWGGGKVRLTLLAETNAAIRHIREIILDQPVWLDQVHIGLNDLSLERKSIFLFEPVATGEIAQLSEVVRRAGRRFGFGGIGYPGSTRDLIPAEWILGEHVRVASSVVILSRAFHDALSPHPSGSTGSHAALEAGVATLRMWEELWRDVSPDELARNHARLREGIMDVVKGRLDSVRGIGDAGNGGKV